MPTTFEINSQERVTDFSGFTREKELDEENLPSNIYKKLLKRADETADPFGTRATLKHLHTLLDPSQNKELSRNLGSEILERQNHLKYIRAVSDIYMWLEDYYTPENVEALAKFIIQIDRVTEEDALAILKSVGSDEETDRLVLALNQVKKAHTGDDLEGVADLFSQRYIREEDIVSTIIKSKADLFDEVWDIKANKDLRDQAKRFAKQADANREYNNKYYSNQNSSQGQGSEDPTYSSSYEEYRRNEEYEKQYQEHRQKRNQNSNSQQQEKEIKGRQVTQQEVMDALKFFGMNPPQNQETAYGEIKKKYREMAKKSHSDTNNPDEQGPSMYEVNNMYEILETAYPRPNN